MESGRSLSSLESGTLLAWGDGVYERVESWVDTTTYCESVWMPAGSWWKMWTWRDRETLYTRTDTRSCRPERVQEAYQRIAL